MPKTSAMLKPTLEGLPVDMPPLRREGPAVGAVHQETQKAQERKEAQQP
jgi:hypothetical protein